MFTAMSSTSVLIVQLGLISVGFVLLMVFGTWYVAKRVVSAVIKAQQMQIDAGAKQVFDVQSLHNAAREEAKSMELITVDPEAPSKVLAQAAMLRTAQLRHQYETAISSAKEMQDYIKHLNSRRINSATSPEYFDRQIAEYRTLLAAQEAIITSIQPQLEAWGMKTEKLARHLHSV